MEGNLMKETEKEPSLKKESGKKEKKRKWTELGIQEAEGIICFKKVWKTVGRVTHL